MKYIIILFTVVSLYAQDSKNSFLQSNYSFSNLNLNYFDWDIQSENSSNKSDFSYVGFEGGIGWNNVDIYGFLNIENPTHRYGKDTPDDLRFSTFMDVDIEVQNNFKIHLQNFTLNSDSYFVDDLVFGVGYKINTNFGLWCRPFLGIHYTTDTYYSGINGYMGGWLLNYDFKMFDYKFSIFQWNEVEFARDKEFYLGNNNQPIGDGDSWGINGALSLWVHLSDSFTVGTQYRYAKNKLGYKNYQSGMIYTVKYNFLLTKMTSISYSKPNKLSRRI